MPNLLNINNFHYRRGGADVMFLEQSRLFTEAGWNVVEFSMTHDGNEPSPWSDYFVDEIDFSGEYSIGQKVMRSGRVVYSRQAQRRLGKLLDDVTVDVAHVHNVYHHISPSILSVLHKRGIPTVLTTHDLKLACPAYQMITHDGVCERCKGNKTRHVVANRCIKNSAVLSGVIYAETVLNRALGSYVKNVDLFVSPSRFYIEKFAEWGFDPSQFTYVPNYIDPSTLEPSYEPGDAVVYFGRLSREKGLATLIRASAASGVPVWIVGTGPEEAELRALVDEVRAPVEFFGYLSGEALHERVRAARASVLPSEWYENAPIAVLESYALGKPFLGARIGGITELVRVGETGYSFESSSVDDLAQALSLIRDLPDADVIELGRAGRRWMEDDFSSARYVDRVSDLYRGLGVR